MKTCPLCAGKGTIPVRRIHFGDGVYKPEMCNVCHGTGEVEEVQTDKKHIVMYYADYRL